MRALAIVPILFSIGALVLSIHLLLAGYKTTFLAEEYQILTLNTSRIGINLLNSSSPASSNPVTTFLHNLTSTLESDIDSDLNSLAHQLGLHDFYDLHLLDYCEGYWTPRAVPNATVSAAQIHKNLTGCSNRTALTQFNPQQILQNELDQSGHGNINVEDLQWPSQVNTAIYALRFVMRAMFILYCISIGLIGLAILIGLLGFILNGRITAFINFLLDLLAFFSIGVASALTTVIAVKVSREVNHYGNPYGIAAYKGWRFLVLTWVCTGFMLIAVVFWFLDCVVGRGGDGYRRRERRREEKYVDGPRY